MLCWVICWLFCLGLGTSPLWASDDPPSDLIKPSVTTVEAPPVDWAGLFKQSVVFLGAEHGFRLLAQPTTRAEAFGLGSSYTSSVGNLHGWADGDNFLTNYVGHPMQGAVASYIWIQNDTAYDNVEIGRDPRYWKSRLRATAFSFAYSIQFEIGPLSEASIGHAQRDFPQQGLVDEVVTPIVGLGWVLTEDALDKYVVRRIEQRWRNPYIRIVSRSLLNPSRSMANLTAFRVPWHREDRTGVGNESIMAYRPTRPAPRATEPRTISTMELSSYSTVVKYSGGPCVGGGGEASLRIAPEWQIVLDVAGCKMMGLRDNVSGDALTFRIGPRWTPSPDGRFSPYAHVLVGGSKFTQEELFPDEKQKLMVGVPANASPELLYQLHNEYTQTNEAVGLSIAAASGVDINVNRALAVRLANFEYNHNWVKRLNGIDYQNSVQFTTGVVLRLGTW